MPDDDPYTLDVKRLRRAEIEAAWQNYIEKKRALKGVSRMHAAEEMKFDNMVAEAKFLYLEECKDKKLNRGYYYFQYEPGCYV